MRDYEHDSIELHREANDTYFGAEQKYDWMSPWCANCEHDSLAHTHHADSKHKTAWTGPCCHGGCSCPEYVPETEEAA